MGGDCCGVVFGVVFVSGGDLTGGFVTTTTGGVGFGPLVGLVVLCAMLLMIERMLLSILLISGELGEGPGPRAGVVTPREVTVIVLSPS